MPNQSQIYKPSEELVIVVDEENRVIGSATRAQMRAQGLIHRATYILVFDTKGRLFVQKRTVTKDIYPGYYDVAAGGVVLAGESYEESASRELFEELGIQNVELSTLFDHYHGDAGNKVWGRIFSCIYDGPMILQKEEIESGKFMEPLNVLKLSSSEPYTPDGIEILRRYLGK